MKWFVVFSVMVYSATGCSDKVYAQSAAAAIKQAQRTGRPIFAVAGATYCPHCVTLMKRLNTEERLQPLIAEFVPLKLDVSSRDFKTWEKFFPRERSAVPALYIVTPEGEQLYGKLGSLPTEKLEKVLVDTLTKAGRLPSEQQWKELDEATRRIEKLLDEGKLLDAVEQMQPHFKLMSLYGNSVEYHETGRRISTLVQRVVDAGTQHCNDLMAGVSEQSTFEQALQIVRTKRAFATCMPLEAEIKRTVRSFGRTSPAARRELRHAQEFDRAVFMLSDPNPKQVAKAVRLLERIIERYPGTHEASVRARAELERLGAADDGAENQPTETSAAR